MLVKGTFFTSKYRDNCTFPEENIAYLFCGHRKESKLNKLQGDPVFREKIWNKPLTKFYFDCLLPEIIDPRYPRNEAIRNPLYILETQKQKGEKRKKTTEN